MLTKEQARELALKEILRWWDMEDDEPAIIDEETIEEDFGWVFFYQSRIFLETQIFSYALAGNAPIIINKSDGSLHPTGTARSIEDYIEEYRKALLQKPE
jgi:hypothetical protein